MSLGFIFIDFDLLFKLKDKFCVFITYHIKYSALSVQCGMVKWNYVTCPLTVIPFGM